MPDPIQIVPLTPELSSAFAEMWVAWLRVSIGKEPEPEDLAAVQNPEEFYIAPGGAVFYALKDGVPVGVVAVKFLSPGVYEFCKLVVRDEARGYGAGRQLVERCLRFVHEAGGHLLALQSFRRLEVAVDMYERMGFEPIDPPPGMNVLARTEIIMGMNVDGGL
jgi:GNAT superfamily N-acetyltransferase